MDWIREFIMTENEFVAKFLSVFAKNINEHQKRKNHVGGIRNGYLWNLFGNNLVPCYEGDNARTEYNIADKTGAIEVFYDSPCLLETFVAETLSSSHLTADGIDNSGFAEFYIIAKDFSWCYVVTHGFNACGPYFCYAPQTIL